MTRVSTCGIGAVALLAALQAVSGLLAFLGGAHSPRGLNSRVSPQLRGFAASPPEIAGQEARAEFSAPLLLPLLVVGSSLVLRRRQRRQQLQSSIARCAAADGQSATATPGGRVIGIDLGTTNSAVAVIEAGSPVIIPNAEGKRTTPSVVAYTKNGELIVGENAKRQAVTNPRNTFQSVKRFVGRQPSEVKEETRDVAYHVVSAANKVQLDCPQLRKRFAPEEISATVLRKLAEDAGRYLGEKVTKAVITVPAYFNDAQRQATKDAGKIAGLEVLRIINEPTAAALAYGLDKRGNETIMVFDLGGGTFDVSVLEVGDGVVEVLATNGDTHLGGDDFDRKIVEWLASEFRRKERVDLLKDEQALQRLTEAAEKAKIDLSAAAEARISLPFITSDASGPKHLEETLTRAKFEKLVEDLVQRCRRPCEQALKDANLKAGDVNEVVLVGGSTRIPAIQELAKSLGSGRPLNQSVNPDEVVAIGAAIQAGVISGEVTGLVLLDVAPLSLGVETLGGVCTTLIPRNTTIPARKTEVFSTAVDAQPSVEIAVLQGERQFAKDNKMLGTFRLEGLPPAPRGVPQIEVTFDIDANGILDVSAKDRGTGKQQNITISGSSTLSADDVDAMVRDAEANAAGDAQRRALVEARNSAEGLSYQAEKQLREFGDQVPQDLRESIEAKAAALREAASSAEEADDLKRLSDELQGELVRIGEMVYAAASAASPAEADVIDVEQGSPPE